MLVAWRLLRRSERVALDSPLALEEARRRVAGLVGASAHPPRHVCGGVRGERVRLRGVGSRRIGDAFHEPRRTAVLRGRLSAAAGGSRFEGSWAAGREVWALLAMLPPVLLALVLALGLAVDVSVAAGLVWLAVAGLPLLFLGGLLEQEARRQRERGGALERRLRERLEAPPEGPGPDGRAAGGA